jgi:ADP-heptose:LPS heptosyltransferase
VVRLDNAGDVLVAGPAVRAVAAGSDRVTLLAGPQGAAAAALLPGVDQVIEWLCPWIAADPDPVAPHDVGRLTARVAGLGIDRALVLTSFHQSPLPTALVLRMAGIPWLGAVSDDYPGTLLDLRHRVDDDLPEAERALSLALAAGFSLPGEDDGGLGVRRPLPDVTHLLPRGRFVVLHPGTSVPARAWSPEGFAGAARVLTDRGHGVVVTGGSSEAGLTRAVCAGTAAVDLGGRTSLAELAAVLDAADVVVVGNTGPAHLAAAVRTPVVSLFAPTVPAVRWAPYAVPTVLLGDQQAPCRGTRATTCPVEGHPCLTSVRAEDVLRAVERLTGTSRPAQVAGRGIGQVQEGARP